MGVHNFFHEVKTNASPKRLFKALVTEWHEVLPKVSPSVKSADIEGDGGVGSVNKTTFADGSILKNRVDFLDKENYVAKFTTIEGPLGDKLEKVCFEMKFEDSKDGGCVIKITSDYHTKGDADLKEEDVNTAIDQALAVYKATGDYLAANPHVCA